MTQTYQRPTSRWTGLRAHAGQADYYNSNVRFNVVPCGRRCLEEGTQVMTPNGSIEIQHLNIGDEVIGYEDGEARICRVSQTWDNDCQMVYPAWGDGKVIKATWQHNLWARYKNQSNYGRAHIGSLIDSDYYVKTLEGEVSLRFGGEPYLTHTYDITVDNSTNLYVLANGIITSNSGKTELAKRRLVRRAIERAIKGHPEWPNGRFFAAAPTRDQVKRIYWQDLKALVPKKYLNGKPSESLLIIPLINDVEIHIIGMDKPERFEGSPWDGGILDEYANMKEKAWMENVFPALADRQGWCDLIGVPEGRNHYYHRYKEACSKEFVDMMAHHWTSEEILPASEIALAKRMLDDLSYAQEYLAEFVNFAGRCYYAFTSETHVTNLYQNYNPAAPIGFCFDFNVSPGVAAIVQETALPGQYEVVPDPTRFGYGSDSWNKAARFGEAGYINIPAIGTAVIGEVYIPQNSNTLAVCRRLIQDWGHHRGEVNLYGDATGGARGSAQLDGSDWDIIWQQMYSCFGQRINMMVPSANPAERVRVNAVNSRLKSMDGVIRLMVDGDKAPHVVDDLESVRLLEGGSGEIDKKHDLKLSHISDALGYYVSHDFPIFEDEVSKMKVGGLY